MVANALTMMTIPHGEADERDVEQWPALLDSNAMMGSNMFENMRPEYTATYCVVAMMI